MDLEKADDNVNWKTVWEVLTWCVHENLLNIDYGFYTGSNVCERVNGGMKEWFGKNYEHISAV